MKNRKHYIIAIFILLIAYCSFLGTALFTRVCLPGDIIDSLEIEVNGINTYDALYPNLVIRYNGIECEFFSREQKETEPFDEARLSVDSIKKQIVKEQIYNLFITSTVPIYSFHEKLKRQDNREVDYVPLDWLFVRFYRSNLLLFGCKREEGKQSITIGDINTHKEQVLYDKEKVIYSETFKKFMANIYDIMDGMNSNMSDYKSSDDEIIINKELELIIDSLEDGSRSGEFAARNPEG